MLKECALRTCRAIGFGKKISGSRVVSSMQTNCLQTVFMGRLEDWLDALLARCLAHFAAISLDQHGIAWHRSVPNVRVCRILAPATHHPITLRNGRHGDGCWHAPPPPGSREGTAAVSPALRRSGTKLVFTSAGGSTRSACLLETLRRCREQGTDIRVDTLDFILKELTEFACERNAEAASAAAMSPASSLVNPPPPPPHTHTP